MHSGLWGVRLLSLFVDFYFYLAGIFFANWQIWTWVANKQKDSSNIKSGDTVRILLDFTWIFIKTFNRWFNFNNWILYVLLMHFSPLSCGETAQNSQHHTVGKRARRGEKREGKDSWVEVCVRVRVWKREAGRRNEKHFWWRMFTLKSACDITAWISINASCGVHVQRGAEGSRTLNASHHRTGQQDGATFISNTSPNGETAWRLCVCCGSAAVRSDAGMASLIGVTSLWPSYIQ